ncbi:MAG: hypothetical protein WCT77_03145, partial [Bacteroidota bacterium]
PDIVTEVYPKIIPNLYKGHQLMVTGRYSEAPDSLVITLKGKAFGKDVQYDYSFNIADTVVDKNNFIGKMWAKIKIDHLITEYHKFSSTADTAKKIREQVIKLSIAYNILTEFTAYKDYNDGLVPVELVEFNAVARRSGITLYWTTASENNNYGFYVERRVGGSDAEWDNVAFIKGAGFSKTMQYYSFTDRTVSNKTTYEYRLRQVDYDGTQSAESTSNIITIAYDFDSKNSLEQNSPNPFSTETQITFIVQEKSPVKIDIIDLCGNIVTTLVDKELNPQTYSVYWDGKNNQGVSLLNGMYLCRMIVGSDVKIQKMLLIR